MGTLNPVIPEVLLNLVCLGLFVQKDTTRLILSSLHNCP